MRKVIALGVALALPAHADDAAPPALTLPELGAGRNWTASTAAFGVLDMFGLVATAAVTYPIGDVELFAGATAITYGALCFEGCTTGTDGETALGNPRLGARYVVRAGELMVAPAVWAWLPASTADAAWFPRARALASAAADSRAFLDEGALGAALDIRWRHERAFVQGQVGTAVVADDGAQVDEVFAALGGGMMVSPRTSLAAEWRVDAYPREAWIHVIGVGLGRGDPAHRVWRLRAHYTAAGQVMDETIAGITLGFDWVQRW